MVAKQPPLQRACVACHRTLTDDANVCPHCGHDYRPAMSGHGWESEGTPLPPIGGALIAFAGFAQAVSALSWWAVGGVPHSLISTVDGVLLVGVLGLIAMAAGAIAIAGGAFAITRRRLALALIGGAAAVAGGGVLSVYSLVALSATTLGLIGMILVGISRDEFID